MGVRIEHLRQVYSEGHDPWGFEDSSYERDKFVATRKALSRNAYRSAFELGCGNGELASHLSGLCGRYTGMDAIDTALEAASGKVPKAKFVTGFYPCELPTDEFDLLIFSEILYFLDHDTLKMLAFDVVWNWPDAELICVSHLGPSGNELQGGEAVTSFITTLSATHDFETVTHTQDYRIDRGLPQSQPS